jgi:hypothetical protein
MRMRGLTAAGVVSGVAALLLTGCAGTGDESPGSPTPNPTASVGNGAFIVEMADGSAALLYPIGADGALGAPAPVPWESGPAGEGIRLLDAVGPWALTATFVPPLTDVSRNTQLQVRDVVTGEVLHQLDVPGWCSGPDGADYPCLLLDDMRMARSTPLDGIEDATVTIGSTETGETLAEFGPFPALAAVRATNSPDALVLISYDGANQRHTAQRLDVRTGATAPIGSLPTTQPLECILGADSILTVDDTTLQAVGPAPVAPTQVPELGRAGPGAVGCTPDGRYLYVRTDWTADPEAELVIDAISLTDGARTPAVLSLTTQAADVRITR